MPATLNPIVTAQLVTTSTDEDGMSATTKSQVCEIGDNEALTNSKPNQSSSPMYPTLPSQLATTLPKTPIQPQIQVQVETPVASSTGARSNQNFDATRSGKSALG